MRKIEIIVLLFCACVARAQHVDAPLRVGLLLPFQVENTTRDKTMDRYVDFYTGALVAVYEMQEVGQRVEVHTYDVGKSAHQLEQVLLTDALDSLDLIIGPVYSSQVRRMAEWTSQHHVLTFLPFAYEVPELATNPYLLQFNPTEAVDAEALVNDVMERRDSVRFVFVEADPMTIPTSVHELKNCVRNDGLDYVYTSIQQIMADSLGEVLGDSVENIFVMNTERYANLRQIMPHLLRSAQGRSLTLVTRYAWQDEPIILPQIYTTMFRKDVDVDSLNYGAIYRSFVEEERVVSRPCYDLLGYDIMTYSLETLVLLKMLPDEGMKDDIIERSFTGLQSDIRFARVDSIGGYLNNSIHVIRVR